MKSAVQNHDFELFGDKDFLGINSALDAGIRQGSDGSAGRPGDGKSKRTRTWVYLADSRRKRANFPRSFRLSIFGQSPTTRAAIKSRRSTSKCSSRKAKYRKRCKRAMTKS